MGLNVVWHGHPVRLEVEDASTEPSALLLLSEGASPEAPTGTVVAPGGNDGEGIWTTFIREPLRATHPRRLRIDTSQLPGGPVAFDRARFMKRTGEELARQGGNEAYVALTPEGSVDWGLVRTRDRA